jgi:hypothetical protein
MDTAGLTFHEDWFSDASCAALANLVRSVEHIPGRIIEVGSWEGRSTIARAHATDRPIHAVDTWEGSPGEISADLAAGRDVYRTWLTNVSQATDGNVVEHRMGWREYRELDDSPVALLFIDAEHTYREVADNIDAYMALMSPGGIICGDDVHHPPIVQAVLERFPHATREASLWVHRIPPAAGARRWPKEAP